MITQALGDQQFWYQIFNFDGYGELLVLVRNSLLAGAVLGLVGGLVGTFVMMRDLPFAVHGRVAVRNSRYPGGPALIYTAAEISAFILGAKDGEFDHLIR
jgi:zinc/manganese transport system permease protein